MTGIEIVSFGKSEKSGENVIDRLEEGRVDNCAIIIINKNTNVMDFWENGNSPFVLVGAIETLKREFMDEVIDSRD